MIIRLRISLLLLTTLLCSIGYAQQCCTSNQNLAFADFANDKTFLKSHDLPGDYIHESETGKMITYSTKSGVDANAYFLKRNNSNKWLIVIHEWWGLNEYIKRESEKLYRDLGDVNIIAIDLYDGKVAKTREDAGAFMKAASESRCNDIIYSTFKFAGDEAKFATIGWCFGGGWSLKTAILAGNRGLGCVVYYGMPVSEVSELKKINGPVIGIFADNDQWINKEVVKSFKTNMAKASKPLEVYTFDADHAFANPSSEKYKENAAQEAYQHTLKFLQSIF